VDQGLLSPEEAQEHPLGNVITRAVGSSDHLDIDTLDFPLELGDVFLLCTDGLNKAVKDSEIAYLMVHAERHEIVETLIQTALARGATDNVTVVVVSIEDE
jgi:serine/threonine protein phosphatase PrpC